MGDEIEALDDTDTWRQATVIEASGPVVKIHYSGLSNRYDVVSHELARSSLGCVLTPRWRCVIYRRSLKAPTGCGALVADRSCRERSLLVLSSLAYSDGRF